MNLKMTLARQAIQSSQPTRQKGAYLMPSLHASIKNRTTARAIAIKSSMKEAIYATPSVCRQPGGYRWWNLHCSHSRKAFAGLYSIPERDQILRHFKGRQQQIDPPELGSVAAQAMGVLP